MRLGYFLSSEEYTPADLLDQARRAADAGFGALWISDHYHPWLDTQGQSPFVWSMIGAVSQVADLPIGTAVVYVSGFGPDSTKLAAELGDGYISTQPDGELVSAFRELGGGGKTCAAGLKGCWAPTEEEGLDIAHRLWPTEGLPGELAQVLPDPEHFAQAVGIVAPEAMKMPHGPDPKPYIEAVETYRNAGFDEVYIASVGPHHRESIDMFAREIIPGL